MRLGIDGRGVLNERGAVTGISLFSRELLEAMQQQNDQELIIFGLDATRAFLRRWPIVGNHWAFAKAVDQAACDVFFSPHGLLPLGLKTPAVVYVADLIMLKHPEWFPDSIGQRIFTLRLTLPRTVRRARRILVPSEIVRQDFGRFFPAALDKIVVVPAGIRPLSGFGIPAPDRPFILSVGTLEPRKNFATSIKAFEAVANSHPDLDYLIIGSRGWGADSVFATMSEVNQRLGREAVRYLGCVSEAKKWALYRGARLLLAPSFDEGFYLPPFEAMAVGTPVISTLVGAIPDLARTTVVPIEPLDIENQTQAIERLLRDAAWRAECVQAGNQVSQMLTWEATARGILACIEGAKG